MQRKNREPQSPVAALLIGIFGICFGVFWTIMAGSLFPPMALFGILFIAIASVNTYGTYKAMKEHSENPGMEQDYKNEQPESIQPEELRCP